MKQVNTLWNKITNQKTLEFETFDLIDVFAEGVEERLDDYSVHAAKLEMDVSQGVIPFPKLNRQEVAVWTEYCPTKNILKEYENILPLEVIKLASICIDKKWFSKVEVWSEAREDIDPVLVGFVGEGYNATIHLLARWGASLRPFEEIRKIAMERWKERRLMNIQKKLKSLKEHEAKIDEDTFQHFNESQVWEIY